MWMTSENGACRGSKTKDVAKLSCQHSSALKALESNNPSFKSLVSHPLLVPVLTGIPHAPDFIASRRQWKRGSLFSCLGFRGYLVPIWD